MTKKLQLFLAAMLMSLPLMAEETTTEKATIQVEKAGNSVKKTVRKADDKVCEMFHGKVRCVAKKVKHTVENAADALSADGQELKNKVDSGK